MSGTYIPIETSLLNQVNYASQKWSSETVEAKSRILDMEKYNGRLNLMELPPKDVRFDMYEKIALKNKSSEYRDSLAGILEDNLLSRVFFSSGNIQIIQNGLRAGVYELSEERKIVIAPQNIDNLKIIMRSIYLQYAEHREDISVTKQVENLNKIVLEYVIPTVYNETMGYLKYIQDQSTLVQPLALPQMVDKDHKPLEWKRWF
jgi:hypothetical protein